MANSTFYHGYTIAIQQDDDPMAPDDWDGNAILVTTRNRYFSRQPKGFDLDEIRDGEFDETHFRYPLFMYAHSGVALSMSGFADPWDSGQCGYVLVPKDKTIDWDQEPVARQAAQQTVAAWNQYLSGDVWGYVVTGPGDVNESCWGFYGRDFCEKEARSLVDTLPRPEEAGCGR
jgi:hypothetical protein